MTKKQEADLAMTARHIQQGERHIAEQKRRVHDLITQGTRLRRLRHCSSNFGKLWSSIRRTMIGCSTET
jgi:hypothetical protein